MWAVRSFPPGRTLRWALFSFLCAMHPGFRSILLTVMLVPLVAACELTGPSDDRIVAGVNVTELFAPATPAERQTVLDEWATRATPAVDVQTVHEAPVTQGGAAAHVRIVTHRVGSVKHYGAIISPDGAAAASLPVLMYSHGGDAGVSVDGEVLFILQFLTNLADRFVIVVPSFRDETLKLAGQTWKSDGPASPWDYDVDDALSLLTVALETTPSADPTRVAVLGMSRGAGVALLAAARDPRIDRVVEFFGPTDFFGPFVQEVTEELLMGSPRNLPGLDVLNASFLQPFADGTLPASALRVELARRSPVLFVDRMPAVQVHHGRADVIVYVSQAEAFIKAMKDAGRTAPDFESFLYGGGEHNPLTLTGSFDRTYEFLAPMLR